MTFCRFRTSFSVLEAPVPDLSGKGVGWNPESGLGSRSELHELPFLNVVPDSDMTFLKMFLFISHLTIIFFYSVLLLPKLQMDKPLLDLVFKVFHPILR